MDDILDFLDFGPTKIECFICGDRDGSRAVNASLHLTAYSVTALFFFHSPGQRGSSRRSQVLLAILPDSFLFEWLCSATLMEHCGAPRGLDREYMI